MVTRLNRRKFNGALAGLAAASALAPFNIVRAQSPKEPPKLKVGVLLPRSGFQGFIGQSCQKGADLAPGVLKELLGVDVELLNANVDKLNARLFMFLDYAIVGVNA